MNFLIQWFAQRKLRSILEMPMLTGYKTYIVGALIGFLTAAESMGLVPPEAANTLREMLLGLGLVTLRAGIKKVP